MNRLLKLSIATLLLATLAGPAWASGGGEPKAPFPVPLACYTMDAGAAEFQAKHCSTSLNSSISPATERTPSVSKRARSDSISLR